MKANERRSIDKESQVDEAKICPWEGPRNKNKMSDHYRLYKSKAATSGRRRVNHEAETRVIAPLFVVDVLDVWAPVAVDEPLLLPEELLVGFASARMIDPAFSARAYVAAII